MLQRMRYFDILVGVPASGKSTYVNESLAKDTDIQVLSTDDLVMHMGKAEGLNYNEAWAKYIKDAEKLFWEAVLGAIQSNTRHVIIDRTNLTKKSRARFFNLINNAGKQGDFTVSAIVFGQKLPLHEWYQRLASRPGKTIPPHVIMNQVASFEEPDYDEGFNAIIHCH